MIENEITVSVPLEVVKASEIEPKEVKWLWYPYILVGKVMLLQGNPGDGKSKLMKEQKHSYSQRIGKTTFIVNVKQSAVRKCQKAFEYGVSGHLQARGFGRLLYGQIV